MTTTIRLAESSGNEAWASFRAEAMFVASVRSSNRAFERANRANLVGKRRIFDRRLAAEDDDARLVLRGALQIARAAVRLRRPP